MKCSLQLTNICPGCLLVFDFSAFYAQIAFYFSSPIARGHYVLEVDLHPKSLPALMHSRSKWRGYFQYGFLISCMFD